MSLLLKIRDSEIVSICNRKINFLHYRLSWTAVQVQILLQNHHRFVSRCSSTADLDFKDEVTVSIIPSIMTLSFDGRCRMTIFNRLRLSSARFNDLAKFFKGLLALFEGKSRSRKQNFRIIRCGERNFPPKILLSCSADLLNGLYYFLFN